MKCSEPRHWFSLRAGATSALLLGLGGFIGLTPSDAQGRGGLARSTMRPPAQAGRSASTSAIGLANAQAELPLVHVIATGGTIASRPGAGSLTGEQLIRAVPELRDIATITVEQFSNIGSSQITPEHWLRLARRVNELREARPELAGIVVTHGTDTMEETAYFLELTIDRTRPVVLTGAMRPPGVVAAEGAANLYNAVRVAAMPAARERGVLVLMNDEVFAARDVTKRNTSRLDAFGAPGAGPVGVADADTVVFLRPPPDETRLFDLAGVDRLSRVGIAYSYGGADGTAIDAFVAAGVRGLVVAAVGRGNLPAAQWHAAERAAAAGVLVVVSSRTGSGRVPVRVRRTDAAGDGPGAHDAPGIVAGAGRLNPQKARVLLMLALSETVDPERVAEIFRQETLGRGRDPT